MTNYADNFWSKVDRKGPNECWPWLGKSKSDQGYGRMDFGGEEGVYANRIAYSITHPGKITLKAPKDRTKPEFVRHSCDNPGCCNPRHLLLGTHDENMKDKVARGRSILWEKSTESPRAKLTAEDVFWIRMQKKYGTTVNALAMLYEVSRATISGCLYGRHYQDV